MYNFISIYNTLITNRNDLLDVTILMIWYTKQRNCKQMDDGAVRLIQSKWEFHFRIDEKLKRLIAADSVCQTTMALLCIIYTTS